MLGIPLAFVIGYVFARYFGDAVKGIVTATYNEIGKALEEWL